MFPSVHSEIWIWTRSLSRVLTCVLTLDIRLKRWGACMTAELLCGPNHTWRRRPPGIFPTEHPTSASQLYTIILFSLSMTSPKMRSGNSTTRNNSPASTPRARGQACERCWKRKQKVGPGFPRTGPLDARHEALLVIPTQVPKADGNSAIENYPNARHALG